VKPAVIRIDLNELDSIKEEQILGIQTNYDPNSDKDQLPANYDQKINFFANLNSYWDNLET